MIEYIVMTSPLGPLLLAANGRGLQCVEFEDASHPLARGSTWREAESEVLTQAQRQLDEYFAGQRQSFDLPLAAPGTEFQQRVWRALCAIPFGTTCSYADIARRVGQPGAVRAVGAANGRNPIAIVVPCHRVIGADGSLTGYAGGLQRKRALLGLEGADCVAGLFDAVG